MLRNKRDCINFQFNCFISQYRNRTYKIPFAEFNRLNFDNQNVIKINLDTGCSGLDYNIARAPKSKLYFTYLHVVDY